MPTPLNTQKDPDLSYVLAAAWSIREALRPRQLIILESTTFPGTTREVVLPVLAETGLAVGRDVFVCFSPERVDPGNASWRTENTPKVIGGATPACLDAGVALYRTIFAQIVPVSSLEAAELAKAVRGSTVLILGVAYKRDVGDMRESTAFEIMPQLQAKGAHLRDQDALCPVIDNTSSLLLEGLPLQSVELSDDLLHVVDAVVIVADHSAVDHGRLAEQALLVIDTRGVMRRFAGRARVVGLSGKKQSLRGRSPAPMLP